MSEALGMARPLAVKAGLEIKLLPGIEDARFVLADRGRVRQVLLNLLANAIKYNRAGGKVTITAEAGEADHGRLKMRMARVLRQRKKIKK